MASETEERYKAKCAHCAAGHPVHETISWWWWHNLPDGTQDICMASSLRSVDRGASAPEPIELLDPAGMMLDRIRGCLQEYPHIGCDSEVAAQVERIADERAKKARKEEVVFWLQFRDLFERHTNYCLYDLNDPSPAADFCTCGLSARKQLIKKHLRELGVE